MQSTTCKLVTKFCSHISWLDASKQATNFAAVVEKVTRVCLAYFQEITPPANLYMYPDVECFLSWHLAKIDYVYTMISKLSDFW